MSQSETAVAQSTKTDQQKQILQEILLTEEHYIEDLKILIEVFKTPILEKKLLTPQDVTRLFSNVESLLAVNEKLYEGLKASDGSYGKVFVEKADTLKLYGIYCSTQSMASVRLKEFTSKFKEFDQFLDKSFDHPRCRQLGLDSFIMSPMQRITKYPLLLGELLKRTPKEDPDNEYITKALGMMRDIVEIVNDRTRSVQNVHRLSDIQRKIIGGEALGLVQKDRELIYQGSLVTDYYGKSKKGVKPWGILFSDFLLLCYFINRPKNDADITEPFYTIQKRVNFDAGRKLVVITEGHTVPEENSFQLIYEKKKSDGRVVEHKPKFYALNRDDKQTWSSKFALIAKKLYTDYKHSAATIRESPASMHSARSNVSEDESDEVRANSSGNIKSARASMKNFKDFRKKMKQLMDKDDPKLERIDSAGDKEGFEEPVKRKDSLGSSSKKKKDAQDMLETINELRQLGVTAATENEMLVHCLVQMHSRIKELETTASNYAQQLSVDFKPRQFDAIIQQTLKKYVPALRGDNTDDSSTNIIEKINQVASKYDEHTSPVKEKRSRLVSTGPVPVAKARPMSVNLTNSAPQTLQKMFDEPQKDKSESKSRRGSKSGKLKRILTEMTGSNKVESNTDSSNKELMTFISPRSLSFAKASPNSFASSLFESPRSRSRRMAAGHRDDDSSFKFNTISSSSMTKDTLAELRNADKPELPPKPAKRKRSTGSPSSDKKKKRAPTPPPKIPLKVGEEGETKPEEVNESNLDKSISEAEENSPSEAPAKKETGPPTEYFRDRFRTKSRSRSLNNMVIVSSPSKMSLEKQSENDEDRANKKKAVSPEPSPAESLTNSVASVASDDSKSTGVLNDDNKSAGVLNADCKSTDALSDDSKSAALPKGDSEASNSEASSTPVNNDSDTQAP